MNSEQQPPPPLPSKKNPRYPSKTCKYAGVTFRASRDKYQARIYKGNKEYNLGLFDVSADAALAYDVAHRLVKKISAAHGKEKETLDAYESENKANNQPDWLDYGENADANSGLDPDKLNFLRPLDYKVERERELKESQIAGTQKHENCPKLDELRVVVHKEAIRVVKIIVGAIDGGTNNYRRKSKKQGTPQDGVLRDGTLKNPSRKRKKSKQSASSETTDGNGSSKLSSANPNAMSSAWVGKDAAEAYYQASGLGRSLPNPSRTKTKEHPFGPPSVVPVGPVARSNPQMMKHMGKSTHKAMMDGDAPKGRVEGENGDNDMKKDRASENGASGGATDNNGLISQDTLQSGNVSQKTPGGDFNFMGMPSYYGMGMGGGGPGVGNPTNDAAASGVSGSGNNPEDFASQAPENYRDFFKNMRNFFPGMTGGAGSMGQGNMMYARAMGQGAGMHNNGMGAMMGMEPPSNLAQGNMFSNGFADQKKGTDKQLENLKFKSMMQGGMERSMMQGAIDRSMVPPGMDGTGPNGMHPGQMSPTTLNMLRSGGFPSSQGNGQNPYGGHPTREQLAGMYGGDRYSHQLRALQSSQFGLNPSSYAQLSSGRGDGPGGGSSRTADQQAFLQSFAGQSANFPPGSNAPVGGGGAGYNPAFGDMAQLFGMSGPGHPSSRNQGGNTSAGK